MRVLPLLLLSYAVGTVDGQTERAIRRCCGGRGSASLYHAKYLQMAVLGLGGVALLVWLRAVGWDLCVGVIVVVTGWQATSAVGVLQEALVEHWSARGEQRRPSWWCMVWVVLDQLIKPSQVQRDFCASPVPPLGTGRETRLRDFCGTVNFVHRQLCGTQNVVGVDKSLIQFSIVQFWQATNQGVVGSIPASRTRISVLEKQLRGLPL